MPHDDAFSRSSSPLARLRLAVTFLTRLPWPGPPAPVPLAAAMPAFPVVGALVGLAGGLVYALAAQALPPLAAAALALAATALLTGALHEDGLADLADGLGGGRDRDRKLAIMRDSRIGTYGVVAVTLLLTMRAGALSGLPPARAVAALVAAHALGRSAIPMLMRALAPARADGLGAGAGRPTAPATAATAILGAAIAALVLPAATAMAAVAAAAIGAVAVALLARRQLGGFTGDVLGAAEQVAETAALLAAAS